MNSRILSRRLGAVAGAAAVIALGGLTAACGNSTKESPSSTTTTTTTTTTPPAAPTETVSPTQKSIDPTGGNLFTPSVLAPPAPSVPGGRHSGIGGVP
ncbi:hypothetical protein [Mycolicibacterium fluoranthenivorans]|uniref:Uncharacterized protein n=1 Tax=Mycolicibacterium fluoranthenivorans TaxID=258505 RepID=A0A1G4WUG1_9MYCO|nr:hypothetical protein [Mycolicibacterium fluoranthenivorans]SCX29847.1 hypothetical protein SAMN02799620_04924 [Mycolicibacterium fluoranthenivorans]